MTNKIKERRLALGFSQIKLSQALNVHQTAISQWERGKALPCANKLPKLAHVLGCTVDELLSQDQQAGYANTPAYNGTACIAYYDINKSFISAITLSSIYSTKTFTTPSNTAFLRVSIPKNNLDTAQLELGSTATTYEAYKSSACYLPIRVDLRGVRQDIGELTERVTRVEESAKQAHKRLDGLERR